MTSSATAGAQQCRGARQWAAAPCHAARDAAVCSWSAGVVAAPASHTHPPNPTLPTPLYPGGAQAHAPGGGLPLHAPALPDAASLSAPEAAAAGGLQASRQAGRAQGPGHPQGDLLSAPQ
jgi:hypothetical protein